MKRTALLLPAMVAGLALSGVPALAQGPCPTAGCPAQTIGVVETPAEGATVSGYVRIVGFALDANQVSNVDLFVDGTDEANKVTPAGGANINLPRPDILQFYPTYTGTAGGNPGFEMSFKASSFSSGTHTLYVRITNTQGCCYYLAPRTVKVDNNKNAPPIGDVNFPRRDDSVAGVMQISGWALDDRKIDHVEIYVDGLQERQAVTGFYRPDVAAYYPDASMALLSGWFSSYDTTRLANGVHFISVKAVDDQGQANTLGVRRIQVFNNAQLLPPFGEVEYPLLNATWFGNCLKVVGGPSPYDITDPRYLMHIYGWALDVSTAVERGGVSHVWAEISGVVIKDTRGAFYTPGCHREFLLDNALIDCYGYYRPDIGKLYPGLPHSPNSGFHFYVDVGYLITQVGIKEGNHLLQIKAADKEDQQVLLKEIPINIECATGNLDPPPLAYVDDPYNYKFVNGIFPVLGWALDLDNVYRVRVKIDGFVQIDAVRNVDSAEYGLPSPDVAAVYANYPQRGFARWRFYLDTTKISNSEHDLDVEVIDSRGNTRVAGTRRFLVNNNTLVR